MAEKNEILIYEDKDGVTKVNVKFTDEDIWLTKYQIAEIYKTTRQNIEQHISNIYLDKELEQNATCKNFLQVQKEGSRDVKRNIDHYNLDMIIALGYRVQSDVAVRFRIWATKRLHEYIQKGFALDDERLKQGGNRYFKELLQRIRDIRSSERNFYQQVTDIYATSIDYDKTSPTTIKFFKQVQNKMHYAISHNTAAEIIYNRADSQKKHMGLTSWKNSPNGKILQTDVVVAKNYLSKEELESLELIVSAFLDLAESRAKRNIAMTMQDWSSLLDKYLLLDNRDILQDAGKISNEIAKEKALTEFEKYRVIQDRLYKSDFDLLMEESEKN